MSVVALRHGIGVILAAAALGVLITAGVDVPVAVLLGVPLTLAGALLAIRSGRSQARRPADLAG